MSRKQNAGALQQIYLTALPTRREQEKHGRFLAHLILKRLTDPEVQRLAREYLAKSV